MFKILKGDLNAKPVFVRTHEHLEAHFILCTISLILVRLIQNKIVDYKLKENKDYKNGRYWKMGLTAERIKEALNDWTVDLLPGDYYRFNNIYNEDLKLIIDSFGIEIKNKLYPFKELKHIKQTF